MYYDVLVASQRYHKNEALTYSSRERLLPGSMVEISLQKQTALGIITKSVKKPSFAAKPINKLILLSALASEHLELLSWIKSYYPAPGGLIHGLFAPTYLNNESGLTAIKITSLRPEAEPSLTAEQLKSLKMIRTSVGHSVLLHGITGSGKTRIYIELAKDARKNSRSTIILTPEIGLTPQLTKSFTTQFKDVVVIHSAMTPKERRAAWLAIARSKKPMIVIGPRSALFVPLKSVGLIVVDEMHDSAYKQEQAPYYVTTRVAAKLAELHGAKAILASATPPVSDYFVFREHKLPIVEMTETATGKNKDVKTSIIDLRDRQQFSKSGWLSDTLIDQLTKALEQKEQSLLFLNRRGTARAILCQVCGWQSVCPRCDLPLTYHGDTHQAICHTCGHSEPSPNACKQCDSADIIFKSAGTKTIVTELERLFPKARVKRFDSDLKKAERLQSHYDTLISGDVDILVGTQMLGKGLDLPKLSLVGVILADTALNFPDYTAQERTFQMLNQVIGRVGRGHRASNVVVQTYNPQSHVIKQALSKDYSNFYQDQITEREQFVFPPFCYLLKLSCARRSQTAAKEASLTLATKLQDLKLPIEVIGPTPSFIEKNNNLYRWQIVIKAPRRGTLLRIIPLLPANWHYDLDPSHLL